MRLALSLSGPTFFRKASMLGVFEAMMSPTRPTLAAAVFTDSTTVAMLPDWSRSVCDMAAMFSTVRWTSSGFTD